MLKPNKETRLDTQYLHFVHFAIAISFSPFIQHARITQK